MARKIAVEIVGDSRSLERAFDRSAKSAQKFNGQVTSAGRKSGGLRGLVKTGVGLGVGFTAAQTGISLATRAVKTGIGEWNQQQQVAAQTDSVLRSMGKGAGVTAKHVDKLAGSIMKKTGIDDEQIKGGENLLLTFRNIRNSAGKNNDVFDQATKTVTDFSVRFKKDIPSSAVIVGKALNDPIKGLTSLSRVGVQFTKKQKDQIKAFVKSGQTAKAQKIILRELKDETKGAAEAAGKTLAGQINIARESFRNWMGDLVGKTIPILQRTISWLRDHWPEISAAIQNFWTSVKPTLVAFGDLVKSVVKLIQDHWSQIKPIVKSVADVFKAQMKIMTDIIATVAAVIRGDWAEAWKHFKKLPLDAINLVVTRLKAMGKILGAIGGALGRALIRGLVAGLRAAAQVAKTVIARILLALVEPFSHIPRKLGGGVFQDLKKRLQGMLGDQGAAGQTGLRSSRRLQAAPARTLAGAGAGAAGAAVYTGDIHVHGVQNIGQFENDMAKRHKARPRVRRGAR